MGFKELLNWASLRAVRVAHPAAWGQMFLNLASGRSRISLYVAVYVYLLYNKPANVSVFLSSLSHCIKLLNPRVVCGNPDLQPVSQSIGDNLRLVSGLWNGGNLVGRSLHLWDLILLQRDAVRTELNCGTPSWCYRIACCGGIIPHAWCQKNCGRVRDTQWVNSLTKPGRSLKGGNQLNPHYLGLLTDLRAPLQPTEHQLSGSSYIKVYWHPCHVNLVLIWNIQAGKHWWNSNKKWESFKILF